MLNPGAKIALKAVESIGIAFGPALVALNIFNFIPGKRGYFYENGSEWGIASGVFLMCLALVARKWHR